MKLMFRISLALLLFIFCGIALAHNYCCAGCLWYDAVQAFDAGRWDLAKKHLLALKDTSKSMPASYLLGEIYLSERDLPKAFEALSRPKSDNNKVLNYTTKGMALLINGQLHNAEINFEKCLKLHPNSVAIHFFRGLSFEFMHKAEDSIKNYQKAYELKPDFLPVRDRLGQILSKPAYYEKALNHILYFNERIPNYPAQTYRLARVYRVAGEHDKAIEKFKLTMRLTKNNSKVANQLAASLHDMGRYSEAIIVLEKSLEYYPDRLPNRSNLFSLYIAKGNYKKARHHALKAIETNPRYIPAYFALGQVSREVGNKQEAIKYFEKILEMDPKFERARKEIAALSEIQGDSIPKE